MAVTAIKATLSGLPRRLVADGLIEEATILEAADAAKKEGASLVSYLVGKQQLAARDVAIAAAEEFGVPLMDLDALEIDLGIVKLVNERLLNLPGEIPKPLRGSGGGKCVVLRLPGGISSRCFEGRRECF